VGVRDGTKVGMFEGVLVGLNIGEMVGLSVFAIVGIEVELILTGVRVWKFEGELVASGILGIFVGLVLGKEEGKLEGINVGDEEAFLG
jgi:hypothetical protein